MRFATYEYQGVERAGVVRDGVIHPLPEGVTVLTLLEQEALIAAGAEAGRERSELTVEQVRLLPPLKPPSIRDFVGFEAHIEGVSKSLDGLEHVPEEWYRAPNFYFTNPHAACGAHDDVAVPAGCSVLDFELEVGAVIGRAGRDLTPERAREYIVGYLVFNDWSARDLQKLEKNLGLGFSKGKDFANTLGPYLVTADEVADRRDTDGFLDLEMTVTLNGELIGRDTLANCSWTFEEMVAYAARDTWVRPGDVLGSGTCGWGALAEFWGRLGERTPPPLTPGDEVTLTVERLGTVSNRVVAGRTDAYLPRARKRGRTPRP
ncbi:2-keto-4-pentenoate hydratase/2-oxohepta-3-ene-1,7-dioic acid hydratase in catechol pathway [Streptomyces sp. SAI-135]|uniref:fumarylacetoacetate hydrolase family protein n=1 Tax=unclassified Streptomyces TaxID=2593676 RepID=UPI0024743E5C|nr:MULTISPECIES: fumarylacetoacetate hydrolase family protein [unclassified Streptomyces]MDH6513749.1 2-keto-4-pentenoate hydratase/2-oxohepta-3-ene-1,7-dioic acid hydratase in catechol pathway [Streptomyces sp. SAI-090]MDH6622171.1 2-keto-4-pentenoate hydratase/2-oxohepta-3-ene-1,7-dioic acid hydratase in catechol pathway [Streptomyces sp. SAI-135]